MNEHFTKIIFHGHLQYCIGKMSEKCLANKTFKNLTIIKNTSGFIPMNHEVQFI